MHIAAGESNPEHFFVATQDRALRAAIDRVPGGASIFASVNGLHLQACCCATCGAGTTNADVPMADTSTACTCNAQQ